MYFVTGDEHYYHKNIIQYAGRPFDSVEEMNETIISNHNSVVSPSDITIHAGDFTWLKDRKEVQKLIDRLNGQHIFLKGSHDYWLPRNKSIQIWEGLIEGQFIVVCHYAMMTWARSHYNSWQLYAHSHGRLKTVGKQLDIGVDTNNFYPYSFDQIYSIMKHKMDNPNFIPPERRTKR